jgi:HD-GYP domain-containing protein (c-di-GMP phosphodiesterase class II)
MVHDRPYHRAFAFPVACNEIIRHAGTHFDPDIIEPALSHMEGYLEIPL